MRLELGKVALTHLPEEPVNLEGIFDMIFQLSNLALAYLIHE